MDDLKIENSEAYEHYREMICGPRSMTAYELRSIPIMAKEHGLDTFMKAVLVVATKPNVSSPISYLETVLGNWAGEDQHKPVDLDAIKTEKLPPPSRERDLAVLEQKAREGNEFAQAILRGRG